VKKKCNVEYILRGPQGPVGPVGPQGLPGSANITTTLISNVIDDIDDDSNLILNSSTNNINAVIKNVDVNKTTILKYLNLGGELTGVCNTIEFDSSGNNMYVGGNFTSIGGISANNIAVYNVDTSSWSALGSGLTKGGGAASATCYVIVFDPNGNLYVGGDFDSVNGTSVDNIAVYDFTDETWSKISSVTDLSGPCYTSAFNGTTLYAGCEFETAGGLVVNSIAGFVDSSWFDLGGGLTTAITDVPDVTGICRTIVFNGLTLYAGGKFNTAGGNVLANNIALYTNNIWTNLGNGLTIDDDELIADCNTLAISDQVLFVGGVFNQAGTMSANNIASFKIISTSWGRFVTEGSNGLTVDGSQTGAECRIIVVNGTTLYVGGVFNKAGSVNVANNIAVFNGTTFSALDTGLTNNGSYLGAECNAIGFDKYNNLYLGGEFNTAGGSPANMVVTYTNDYVNLYVGTQLVDTVSLRQTKIILVADGLGYSLNFA